MTIKPAKKTKRCNCIALVNKALEEFNTCVHQELQFNFTTHESGLSGCIVKTSKINDDKRKPARTVMATYCPFCGKKWQ